MLADKAKEEVANKLVIFVDELDRCRPDFAVRLLEQTKNLFKSENILLVFSTDSEQLAYAIGGMYGNGFATSVILEWFFDERLILSEVDPFIIISCNEAKNTGSKFTRLVQEVRSKKTLTIHDALRINRKLESAYMYCLNDASANNELPGMMAACAILPLLVFIQREDTDLFRRITSGADFDAIYEYGKQYDAFNENVRTAIKRSHTAFNEEDSEITNDDIKHYVHKLCVAIFGSPEKTPDYYETRDRMSGFSSPAFSEDVCKRLSFGEPDSEKRVSLASNTHQGSCRPLIIAPCKSLRIPPAFLAPRLVSNSTIAHVAISEFAQWLLFTAVGAYSRWLAAVVST